MCNARRDGSRAAALLPTNPPTPSSESPAPSAGRGGRVGSRSTALCAAQATLPGRAWREVGERPGGVCEAL